MNYYNEIKEEIINNEINKKIKDYSKNKSDLESKCRVGKLLSEAGKQYGEGIIKDYSKRLINDIGKKYSIRYLFDMKRLYLFSKVHPLDAQLTMSHYRILFTLNDNNKIDYYINQVKQRNLGKRELFAIINNNEYERLSKETKNKLITKEEPVVTDFIKNPILIKNSYNYKEINEKILKKLILEDMDNFLKELGNGFAYIESEYKIKMGDRYNYIDILLFNYIYNAFVVVELKVTELKKEYTGQIEVYMNYIDKNIKTINQDKTIGIIICRKDNMYVMRYCSDPRIFRTTYIINKIMQK